MGQKNVPIQLVQNNLSLQNPPDPKSSEKLLSIPIFKAVVLTVAAKLTVLACTKWAQELKPISFQIS